MLPVMAGELDDRDLMSRYRDGDAAAFETLYARHKGPLYRYYLRQGCNEAIAAELFQDVWMKLIRARRNYQPTARFTTYMYQIAHNCLIEHYRRAGRSIDAFADGGIDVEDMPGADCDGPERGAETLQRGERIRAALNALPDEQREAFVLREEGGLSLADIAAATGVAGETAKSRLRYAVSKLRRMLADE
jgi:RNA polymerase sigma-70 factor (ECF subfamily)